MLDDELKFKLLIHERPWEHEPDNEDWVHELTGYKCMIWRHPTHGNLNGYVAIPKGHRVWGKSYDNIEVEVHGGLTYSSEDEKTDEWVFGFDTSHSGDFSPRLVMAMMKYVDVDLSAYRNEAYRDWNYVKEEVHSLARQLKLLDMKDEGESK